MDNVTLRRVHVTIVVVVKTISIANSECMFVAVVIQHARRKRHVVLSSVAFYPEMCLCVSVRVRACLCVCT